MTTLIAPVCAPQMSSPLMQFNTAIHRVGRVQGLREWHPVMFAVALVYSGTSPRHLPSPDRV